MTDTLTGFRNRTIPADLAAPFTPYQNASTGPGIDRALQIPLPEIYPIPSATEFNLLATKQTVGAEVNTDIGIVLDVAKNNIGIIRGVEFDISNMLVSTSVSWTLLLNGAPAPGYANQSIFPRVSPFVGRAFDSFVRIPQGTSVRVVFTNTDGGTYTVGAAISGWTWPQTLGDLWIAKGGAQ